MFLFCVNINNIFQRATLYILLYLCIIVLNIKITGFVYERPMFAIHADMKLIYVVEINSGSLEDLCN